MKSAPDMNEKQRRASNMASCILEMEMIGELGPRSERCWVAQITGLSDQYGFERRFIRGHRDYSHSNNKGSRGIYGYFVLHEGCYYEVQSRPSWSRVDRYFCRVSDGAITRVHAKEVIAWLRLVSKSMSTTQPASE